MELCALPVKRSSLYSRICSKTESASSNFPKLNNDSHLRKVCFIYLLRRSFKILSDISIISKGSVASSN